ncbi:hypothetical protein BN946_scf185000.g44 [Trametes cinnabarina]|uniref:MYND-type domain-containing protein n=1 Tax=Pycnoporus cinnabarinus TaxID=5643 RepID=A0A060S415_PYCCI|nr:hypothetical protein BN946_scf185000.g44 [Trametes cinnabarina]
MNMASPQSPGTTLRHCKWCGKTERPSQKLKKCAACGYVLYCSKQCQRDGWLEHKEACRYMRESAERASPHYDVEVRPYGFTSAVAFSKALSDWTEAHSLALQLCSQAYVLQLGGVNFVKVPCKYMLVSRLVCRTKPEQRTTERNPATTFVIRSQALTEIEEWTRASPLNAQFWDGTAGEREQVAVRVKEQYGNAYACLMPMLFNCDGVSMSTSLNLPVLHIRKRFPLDSASMDMLKDVITLCIRSIDQGFPLRCPDGSPSPIPVPGHFSRRGGKWVWEPFFADWDDYSPTSVEYPALHQAIAALKTGMSPKHLLAAFLSLQF